MISSRLYKLAIAIAEHEGWNPIAGDMSSGIFGSRSYRNHNPGNLRSSNFQVGENGGFAIFYNDQVGFFALLYDLWRKARGETVTGLTAASTLADFVSVYAPPRENDTEAYIDFIILRTGFQRSMTLGELLLC